MKSSWPCFPVTIQGAQWQVPLLDTGSTSHNLVNGNFHVCQLSQPNLWTSIFQTTALAGAGSAPTVTANKAKMISFDMRFIYSPQNSLNSLTPRIVDMWVVKLRKETSMDVLAQTGNMSTAGFNASAASNRNIISQSDTDGGLETITKFNPAALRILAHRQFTIANIIQETAVPDENTSVTNIGDVVKRARCKIKCGNELKPASGTYKQMTAADVMPNDRYYVIHHVGGWDGDDEENGVVVDTHFVLNTKVYV